MPIRLRCPTCQEVLRFGDDVAAEAIRCPHCESTVLTGGVSDADPLGGGEREIHCPRCRRGMRGAAGTVVGCQGCGEAVRVPAGRKFADPDSTHCEDLEPPALGSTGMAPDVGAPPTYREPAPYREPETSADSRGRDSHWRAASELGRERASGQGPSASALAERLPSGRARWFYDMPGMVFLLFSLFVILLVVGRMIFPFLLLVRSEFRPAAADGQGLLWAGLQTGLGALLGGVLAAVYFLGGVALIRRRGLTMARCAAIAACIPCLNALVLTPIGIWACFLAFGHNARRDFEA